MIEIGKYNALEIIRESSVGLYLGDKEGEEVLLPNKYCPENFKIYETLNVFVYRDFANRKVAVTLTPKILLHEFAFLQVKDVATVGAFMDWGMEKDLMVPFGEQRQRMEVGRWYIVYLDIDAKTDRLYASNKIEQRLQNDNLAVAEGDKVEVMVMHKSDIGFSVIVNNIHKGLIFENEIFTDLNIGDKLTGYIKKIREDNKLDISLQPIGYLKFNDDNAKIIYEALLESEGGFIAVTDKSAPDEINFRFGMSKKAFKKAIGALYKDRKISMDATGIKLL
ncbi:MAG: S1-like domain-containing RNA-binding protein [Flavobacteriaceae bacterium]|nr:S1-like domain-containing RNA-binding protein [Flavobacteriaceae bacterium]